MSGATIEEGNGVIIRKGTYMRFEEVQRQKKVHIHKQHFFLDNAIGCFYGTTFKVSKKGHLTIVVDDDMEQRKPILSGENNQFLNDDGSSQKLTKDAIMDLKAQGFEGEDIIEQLVEHSETFEKKTEFSQEKYLNKKRNRHLARITILKPTLRLVCEMVYANWGSKILELRMDTVSQILTMANIHSNMNVLLLENTQSFLAGAILHRMAGLGNVVQLFNGDFPIRLLLPPFCLAEDETKILSGFPMNKINSLHSLDNENCEESPSVIVEEMDTAELEEITEQTSDLDGENSSNNNGPSRKGKRKYCNKPLTQKQKLLRKMNRTDEERKALQLLKEASFDCLIIATKFRAKDVVLRLLEFLAPSRPVVVYSQYKEVLNECFIALKERRNVVNLDLTETWWRSYQVLSMRTHPHIMMDATGGYLLTGIKVDPDPNDTTDNPAGNPVNPSTPDPSTKDKTDITSVTPAGTSHDNPDTSQDGNLDGSSTNFKDNQEVKSDVDFTEPSAKRTKSS